MEKRNNVIRELKSWFFTVILPVAIVVLVNLFVCKLAIVSGDSMYPTLHDRDLLLVWMLGAEPEQGDIIVAETDADSRLHGDLVVKRMIAMEGQTVRIDYDANLVYVDEVPLEEGYLNREELDAMLPFFSEEPVVVPTGCIYVLGDNRNHSGDSRDPEIGMVPLEHLMGVSIARIPIGEWFPKS